MRYLIDTNIVIYYFNGLIADEQIHALLAQDFTLSVITKIEFLGWSRFATDVALYEKAKQFIGYAQVLGITDEIAAKTIELRQHFKTKKPDAIIAATALVNGLSVVTNNTSDFSRLGIKTVSISLQ